MALTKIFDISNRTLAAYRRALEVTSHNIANAANPYFSRQRVIFESDISDLNGGFVWGNGVKIRDVQRVRDFLTDMQLRAANPKLYDSSKQSTLIGQVETIFSEPSDLGLSNLISQFFSSFQELSVTPNSSALRTAVVNAATNLGSKVNSINSSLATTKTDIRNEFKADVDAINSILQELQTVNAQQFDFNYKGAPINDLLDKRDQLIEELSSLVNVTVTIDSNNNAVVSIGGAFAVDRLYAAKFEMVETNGKLSMQLEGSNAPVVLSGGELNALSDVYSNKIPEYQQRLDEIINQLVSSVNDIHSTGYTITNPQQTGVNFFEGYENGVLTINPDIVSDPNNIAISSDGTEGNGDLAITLAELNDAELLNGSTLIDSYSSLISDIGNTKSLADNFSEANQLVVDQLQSQKLSVSGVSVDEEMTNVLKFQRTYEAAAKLISVADELLQTLIDMV